MTTLRKAIPVIFVLASYGYLWLELPATPAAGRFVVTGGLRALDETPLLETQFASHAITKSVHCATVAEISGGDLRAFWYGGSREGARDVAIYSSVLDSKSGQWSREEPIVTPEMTSQQVHRYIKKLGNPVTFMDSANQLWLFYVSVSVGGWSGSAVNAMVSQDDGETWSRPRRLISSPFLNLSTLVKGPPLLLDDGNLALPVYHEFIGLFGELLRLDPSGNVVEKSRLSRGARSLQPVVVPRSPTDAIGFMRYAGSPPGRILVIETSDSGRGWSRPKKIALPNPNAAIACTRLDGGELLLVFNNSETGREDLSLAYSSNEGKTWRVIHQFENEIPQSSESNPEFSYPYLIQAANGVFHLLYTWNRTHIKHVRFNSAWLRERL